MVYDVDIVSVHGSGETSSSAWVFEIKSTETDGIRPKQDEMRQGKRNNSPKTKLELSTLEAQNALPREGIALLKQVPAALENLENLDDRSKALADDPENSAGQRKACVNEPGTSLAIGYS
jgi:hypothetical protein